jgi:polysaccharide transporter, PST family
VLTRLAAAARSLSPELRKIIGNTGWLFFDRTLRLVVGLFVGVWVARYLGPEQFGIFNYAVALIALLSAVAPLGLDYIVVRDLVQDGPRKEEILGTSFALKLAGGIVALSLATGAAWLLNPTDRLTQSLVVIMAAGLIFRALDTIDLWFQSQVQSKYAVYARNTAFLLVAIIRLGLIWIGAPLIAFAWASLAEVVLIASGLVVMYRVNGQRLGAWRINLKKGKALLAQSWPLVLSGMAIMVYMRIDQIMLREMVGVEAVGIYSAATRISEVWYFIPVAVVSSSFPSIVRVKEVDENRYYQRLQKLFTLMAAVALAIAVPMTFLSGTVVRLLFGEHFAAAGPILSIHIWAAIFVFFGVVQSAWFVNEGLTKLAFQRTFFGAFINVVLNFALIPLYAGVGAAVATVVAQAFAAVFFNVFRGETRHMFYLQMKSLTFLSSIRLRA